MSGLIRSHEGGSAACRHVCGAATIGCGPRPSAGHRERVGQLGCTTLQALLDLHLVAQARQMTPCHCGGEMRPWNLEFSGWHAAHEEAEARQLLSNWPGSGSSRAHTSPSSRNEVCHARLGRLGEDTEGEITQTRRREDSDIRGPAAI